MKTQPHRYLVLALFTQSVKQNIKQLKRTPIISLKISSFVMVLLSKGQTCPKYMTIMMQVENCMAIQAHTNQSNHMTMAVKSNLRTRNKNTNNSADFLLFSSMSSWRPSYSVPYYSVNFSSSIESSRQQQNNELNSGNISMINAQQTVQIVL